MDVAVRRAEFLAITGPSGSGKSTLLHLLSALDRPTSGAVRLDGVAMADLSDREMALLRRRRFGYVLQFFNLLPSLSALENVAFPLLLDGARDAAERAREALGEVGLGGRADHKPAELSGGEQQRVALARALVTEPAVIFADEPTGNLDQSTGAEILALLRATSDAGHTVVMVTHDPRSAEYASRAVELVDGALQAPDRASRAPWP
ncbi:MAG TPA: ABC transporter ATP-binding protein [Thermoleophilaceae bacterium]|nr:ABC transporter ATP-binding protein [Thermoleophilaceae bacterium]